MSVKPLKYFYILSQVDLPVATILRFQIQIQGMEKIFQTK